MNGNIKNKQVSETEKLYHIGLSAADLQGADTAILPGDPGRVECLAKMLDAKAEHIGKSREYTSYLATVGRVNVLLCSTGMGGPSVGIAIEELAMVGIKKFIRVGTTGSIQEKIDLGCLLLSTGAVRLDGTSSHYAPIEYPAIADFESSQQIVSAACRLNLSLNTGITASSDTFYPGQERYDSYSGYVPKKFQKTLEEWRKLNVMNFEMESSALFTICSIFGLKAACLCVVVAKRTDSEFADTEASLPR
ncbi:uridine phosphorylase [Piscirickettsia litoralis]|uniref:Uridine phosphorylase n=1 Tax=Piscirickettsia litoralis TaxID=1891921 RepID=A0ABX3A6R4_9GAMM|nr:uridine phosphorylase [Piscirickettsia litoralis]ODN43927.1 uridine phosphorylase [Piscirickettsia litoralis]